MVAAIACRGAPALPPEGLFSRTNLVAWCIVPFDTARRGPEERARMLRGLGIQRLAYDWRDEHVPSFDAEVRALEAHGIELTAWWFPAGLNAHARAILECIRRHGVRPQLWVTMGTEPVDDPEALRRHIADAARTLAPICSEAARLGCVVGLYNHLGWFGEPENQLAVLERLRAAGHENAGIVYNFHHGHAHVPRFAELFERMKPHLLAVNLNGMVTDGDRTGRKIVSVGEGEHEARMIGILGRGGWMGPVGILGHTDEDAEAKLRRELDGLARILSAGESGGAPDGGTRAN